MKNRIHPVAALLIFWYFFVFISTHLFSYFNIVKPLPIILVNIMFTLFAIKFFGKNLIGYLSNINLKNKYNLIIIVFLLLTFIQGLGSAPNTTDAMTYHLPRVMRWTQEQTTFQTETFGSHDFMPTFPDFVLLQIYQLTNNDRFLFLSQWLSYFVIIIITGVVVRQLGGKNYTINASRLLVTTLPIALLESNSTQTDLLGAVLFVVALHVSLILIRKPKLKYALLLGIVLGLGMQVKTTFLFFLIIPFGLLTPLLIKSIKKTLVFGIVILFTMSVLQTRHWWQNYSLYGNILGQKLTGQGNSYINERFDFAAIISNFSKNILTQLPLPGVSGEAQKMLESLHNILNISINDPRTTYMVEYHKFNIQSVLFPQEDIVANPIHLFLLIITGIYLIRLKQKRYKQNLNILYVSILFSFVLFSVVLKWEPYHSRLLIPFFISGIIISSVLLQKRGRNLINASIFLSTILGMLIVMFNVSKPYISYTFLNKYVSKYSKNQNVPLAFYHVPRIKQYFNSRHYLYEPYKIYVDNIVNSGVNTIALNLHEEYEYPLWVLFKNKNSIPYITTFQPGKNYTTVLSSDWGITNLSSYQTNCINTENKFGYVCLSIKN